MSGAIVQEWISSHGGSENVTDQVAIAFPDAPVYCLWDETDGRIDRARVNESWLARTPLRGRKSLALPFMPSTWRRLTGPTPDWIFATTHLFAHHARFSGHVHDVPVLAYVCTPARYIWMPELDERGNSIAVRAASVPLRAIDKKRALENRSTVAISKFISQRIEDCWGIESEVIYPPVSTEAYGTAASDLSEDDSKILHSLPPDFILGASRLIPYKRLDQAIDFGAANELPVVIAGGGPSLEALEAHARTKPTPTIFIDRPSQPLLKELYSRASVYVFPPIEDFGIMPVEAMSTGTPVVALSVGGASETVKHGETGALVSEFSDRAMREAFEIASGVSHDACVARAEEFSEGRFRAEIKDWVASVA